MGKNKYTPDGGLKTDNGEVKQRDHTKSGKKAAKKEKRRLEAIGRQVKKIQGLENRLEKVKNKKEHLSKIDRAQLVLQMIRGGTPHSVLIAKAKEVKTEVVEPTK